MDTLGGGGEGGGISATCRSCWHNVDVAATGCHDAVLMRASRARIIRIRAAQRRCSPKAKAAEQQGGELGHGDPT